MLYLGGDIGHAEAFVEFPAWLAALADFEAGAADLPLVAEADLPFVCAFDAEVFAKAAGAEVRIAGELGLPVFVVVLGVAMQGFVGTAVVAPARPVVVASMGPATGCLSMPLIWPRAKGLGWAMRISLTVAMV